MHVDILWLVLGFVLTVILTWLGLSLMIGARIGDNIESDIIIAQFGKEREDWQKQIRELVNQNADLLDSVEFYKQQLKEIKERV